MASNSVSPGLAADAPGEGEIASLVAAWLADAGLEVTFQTVVFGHGGAGAHAEVESVELADAEGVAGTLVEAERRLCG